MKKLLILFLATILFNDLHAQDSLGNIAELQRLLKERKDRFDAYATSADQHTGIFGTKTKKDLEQSRAILLEIVKTDNRLLNELDHAISRRGMAKADYSVDEVTYKETIDRLTAATDTLNKQLIAAKELNASLQQKGETEHGLLSLFIGTTGLLLVIVLLRLLRH